MKVAKNYIDGEWVPAISQKTVKIINPATQEVLGETAASDRGDAVLAIEAARKAFYETGVWRRMLPQLRADLLFSVAEALEKQKHDFALLECKNQGKPLREANCDVEAAVRCFRYYAGLITRPYSEACQSQNSFTSVHSCTVCEPVGVCAQIAPWNAPLLMAAKKIAPALAAGNSLVFKPASLTPLTTVKLFEIFHKLGFPKGCINLVMGPGGTVGRELAQNVNVDMIAFTGSTETGQSIACSSIKNLKKTALELGGKSPCIIFADADIDQAVEWTMLGGFYNQGEICQGNPRILVDRSIHNQFIMQLVKRANMLTIGNPLENPDIGAMVSRSHMEAVLDRIQTGKKEGARCLCGGQRYIDKECSKGFFIRPTVFDHCSSNMSIIREEIFGPVVTVQAFDSEEQAIFMANDTKYGLAGTIFTKDNTRAFRVASELRASAAWINCCNPGFNKAPQVGYKMSGQGRSTNFQGLEAYQETKQINMNLSEQPLQWYRQRL